MISDQVDPTSLTSPILFIVSIEACLPNICIEWPKSTRLRSVASHLWSERMSISWRPSSWYDIEQALAIQPDMDRDGIAGIRLPLPAFRRFFLQSFWFSVVLEANPPIHGHRLVGFGSAVIVTDQFAEAEIAHPRPDMAARISATVDSGPSPLAVRAEIARANATSGVSVVIVYNFWREGILNPSEQNDVRALLPASLKDCLAGFRIRRLLAETTRPHATSFYQSSGVWQSIAEFPERGRVIHLMTPESARLVSGSVGNLIFRFEEPLLRLRDSDQQLLLAALDGATDQELAVQLGVSFSAVKARWRSIFTRIPQFMPASVVEADDRERRGAQKRHRVVAYIRNHPEELRPYDWKLRDRS
jgi:hypothetical protein